MAENQKRTVYLTWDILYKSRSTKQVKEDAIKELLAGIGKEVNPKVKAVPLDYEIFRSEANKLLYILRIYTQAKSTGVAQKALETSSSDSSLMSATRMSASIALSGPIHPPGPPSNPPPGVVSIEEL